MATKIPLVISAGRIERLQAGDTFDVGDAYTLVDGTRPFTGVVGGITPVSASDLATKEYVDESVRFINQLYTSNTASDIGGIYYVLKELPTGEAEAAFTSAPLDTGTRALVNFASLVGVPGVTRATIGVYAFHIHAAVTAGNKPTKIFFEMYKRASGGAEVLLATSELSDYITDATGVDIHATLAAEVALLTTDRLVFKFFAEVGVTGSAVTVVLYVEGATSSFVSMPTTTEILSSTFLRQDGTRELVGNMSVSAGMTIDGRDISVDGATLDDIALDYSLNNALINGGFDFFQRTPPGTLTAVADDVYGPDRWNILTQTTSVQIQRITGDSYSVNACQLKQNQAAAQRMGLLQIIEAADSRRFRGRSAILQARVKCSANQAIRIAILEWTGTANSVTSDVVLGWTSATYTANNFFLAASLTITGVSSVLPDAGIWTDISISASVGTSCNNLIAFIWVEGTAAQNVTLDVAEAGLYLGSVKRSWNPKPIQQELALCQRYYEKSYDLDTPPATSTGTGCKAFAQYNTRVLFTCFSFVTSKFKTPTVYIWSGSGTLGKMWDPATDTDTGANGVAQAIGTGGWRYCWMDTAVSDGLFKSAHFSAEAEL